MTGYGNLCPEASDPPKPNVCYAVLVAEAVRVAGRWRSLRSGLQSWHGLLLHTCLLALQKPVRFWWSCWEMFSGLIWRWSAPDAQGCLGATVPFFRGPCRVEERSRGKGESLGTVGEFLKCNSWYESKYFRLFQILCSQSSVNASVFEIWNWSDTAGPSLCKQFWCSLRACSQTVSGSTWKGVINKKNPIITLGV